MFVVIERCSSRRENGEIHLDSVDCHRIIHETREEAEDEVKRKVNHYSRTHRDTVKLSDSKIQYNYVGEETFSEFLVGELSCLNH